MESGTIAARLRQQEERVGQLTGKVEALERENRELRSTSKALVAANGTIEALRESEAAARKKATAESVRARGLQAEVARVQVDNAKLQAIVDQVAARDAADRDLEALLAGGR